jgi:hypothetical protein
VQVGDLPVQWPDQQAATSSDADNGHHSLHSSNTQGLHSTQNTQQSTLQHTKPPPRHTKPSEQPR